MNSQKESMERYEEEMVRLFHKVYQIVVLGQEKPDSWKYPSGSNILNPFSEKNNFYQWNLLNSMEEDFMDFKIGKINVRRGFLDSMFRTGEHNLYNHAGVSHNGGRMLLESGGNWHRSSFKGKQSNGQSAPKRELDRITNRKLENGLKVVCDLQIKRLG